MSSLKTIRKNLHWLLVVTSMLLTSWAHAAPPADQEAKTFASNIITDTNRSQSINFDVFEDTASTLTLEQLLTDPGVRFTESKNPASFGYRKSTIWLRFTITNNTAQVQELLLEVAYPLLNYVDLYVMQGNEISHKKNGSKQAFNTREVAYRNPTFKVSPQPNETVTAYLSVKSDSSLIIPVKIWKENEFTKHVTVQSYGQGIYFGIMLAMVVYNIFVMTIVKERTYLYYALFQSFTFLFYAVFMGFGKQFFATDSETDVNQLIPITMYCGPLSAISFACSFLRSKALMPRLHKASQCLTYAGFFGLAMAILLPYSISIKAALIYAISISALTITMSFQALRGDSRSARYFSIAWTILLLGTILISLRSLGVLNSNIIIDNAQQIGSALEAILLSIALADRINILRKEKMEAMDKAHTAERLAAISLAEANTKLKEALTISEQERKKKDQFIMAVGHELRTPLNAITSSVQHLPEAKDEAEKTALNQYIQIGAERLSGQVENLVMLAETECGSIALQAQRFSIDAMMKRLVRLANGWLYNKPVKFRIDAKGEFTHYRGDEHLLFRCLLTLLDNACKFTEQGEVIVHLVKSEKGVDFCIEDTGIGMTKDMQARMFECFTQASEGYQRTHEGLGIGLTVCQRLANVLGAVIDIESWPGVGTRFCLQVPMQAEAPEAPKPLLSSLVGHVLIVEDNPVNAKVLNALLKKLGMSAEVAENGLIALDMIRSQGFDMVLMDLQMPVMDGFTSAAEMRARGVSCPIIAVTANSDSEARARCIDVGMNDVIAKPLNKDIVLERLGGYLISMAA